MVLEEELLVEGHTIGFHLLSRHGQRGLELSVESALLGHGNLPDAEEAQHVVYAVGVEVLGHLAETAHPPLAAVAEHLVPVVGGESPVLSVLAEGVGGCSGLSVHVEVAWLGQHVHAVAVHADGYVALQYDMLLPGVLVGGVHLLVQVELHVVPECGIVAVVAAEAGVWLQPLLVLLHEGLVGLGAARAGALLCVELAQVLHLGAEHALIVYLRQRVQLLPQLLVVLAALLVLQRGQLPQVHVLRVQGIDADGVVGVAVLPGARGVGVVDGQYLQDALSGLGTPVHHQLQVAEVAHAEAAL